LFDDTTLWHTADTRAPTLADRHYPSAQREVLKLWWEGSGELFVRSRRTRLEFKRDANGPVLQTVPAPITPMTAVEYADFLQRTVQDADASTGKLKAAIVYASDALLLHELPTGATFADVSEAPPPDAAHDDDVLGAPKDAPFIKLQTTQDTANYVLRHAPKTMQAIRFGRKGPAALAERELTVVDGPGLISSVGTRVLGQDTRFRDFFTVGDQISAQSQQRLVTLVTSDGELVISSPFDANLQRVAYQRTELLDETRDGYMYVSDPARAPIDGETVMDYAADFGALMCLGAVPHLLSRAELAVDTLAGRTAQDGTPVNPAVSKVYQVFRNWNLDRRRVNEWRTLVAGGALSEKGVNAAAYDAAMHTPQDPDWRPGVTDNEGTARELGWVPLLRAWIRMASRANHNAIDTLAWGGGLDLPPNRELSRALAYVLDMPDPVELHP
jgi:hypothetical protein